MLGTDDASLRGDAAPHRGNGDDEGLVVGDAMAGAEWFGLGGIVFGSGVGLGALKALWAHGKKHIELDDHIRTIGVRCADEGAKLRTAKEERQAIDRKLELVRVGLLELLVANGLRPPGQGINGEGQ